MIQYVISIRKVTVKQDDGTKVKVKRGYAVAKSRGTYNTEDFARQMEAFAGNNYQRTAFVAIMADITETLRELIAEGFNVDAGNIGKFYPSLSSNGVFDATKFTPIADIKKVYARWGRPEKLADIKDPKPSYEVVATEKYANAGKEAAKRGEQTVVI